MPRRTTKLGAFGDGRACATCGTMNDHTSWCFDVRKEHFLADMASIGVHYGSFNPATVRHWDEFAPILGAALERKE